MMVGLYYVIQEMHSFSMRPAKYFYDKPLTKYLDSKTVLIYRPHPVYPRSINRRSEEKGRKRGGGGGGEREGERTALVKHSLYRKSILSPPVIYVAWPG